MPLSIAPVTLRNVLTTSQRHANAGFGSRQLVAHSAVHPNNKVANRSLPAPANDSLEELSKQTQNPNAKLITSRKKKIVDGVQP
jgi:hypothetical protein